MYTYKHACRTCTYKPVTNTDIQVIKSQSFEALGV